MKVQTKDLRKVYKDKGSKDKEIVALSSLNLELNAGDSLGYIGLNGSGKSTTLKMLVGVLAPTSGTILLNGYNPLTDRKKISHRVGYLSPLKSQLWWDLPPINTFRMISLIYKIPKKQWKSDLDYLSDKLSFDINNKNPIRTLSTGNRVKSEIISTLLPRPDLLVLDEPTLGLDIVSRVSILETISDMQRKYGMTLIFTSHDLEDVETICDQIMIIDSGNIIEHSTVKEIKSKYREKRKIRIEHAPISHHETLDDSKISLVSESVFEYEIGAKESISDLVKLIPFGREIVDMKIESPCLSDIVLDMHKKHG
ncbi:ATP-binding cassette domain-containing protein [Rothia sp. CCM 9419]|uniref:ATP-binding cassette domain-containing protein n=1 Tax=Rothia sp. CCM 9419 TaxID=3402662 RepID=UPI003AEC675D